MFSNLQNKKIVDIQKIISGKSKPRPHFNMTTKRPSQKQIIISMNSENANNFIGNLSSYVTNINRALKNIKSDIMADFVCVKNGGLVISTNKIAGALDLQTIEKYVKNTNNIKANQIKTSRLSQSKSFLKIIDIPFISNFTNIWITVEVEKTIKNNYIFNNVVLVLRFRIIKV